MCTSGTWKFETADNHIVAHRYGHDAGFCSDLNIQIDLLKHFYTNKILHENYSLSLNGVHAWVNYHDNTECLYSKLFAANKNAELSLPYNGPAHDERHSVYKELNLNSLQQLLFKYYDFSIPQQNLYESIIKKYNINLDKTIAMCYRGTDKGGEVTIASPAQYLNLVEDILSNNQDYKVLIQTDQHQVLQIFKDQFKDRCIFLEEMPVSGSYMPVHKLYYKNLDFVRNLNVVIRILANSKYLINHTGNMGLIISGYRGTFKNLYQFNSAGDLII